MKGTVDSNGDSNGGKWEMEKWTKWGDWNIAKVKGKITTDRESFKIRTKLPRGEQMNRWTGEPVKMQPWAVGNGDYCNGDWSDSAACVESSPNLPRTLS